MGHGYEIDVGAGRTKTPHVPRLGTITTQSLVGFPGAHYTNKRQKP